MRENKRVRKAGKCRGSSTGEQAGEEEKGGRWMEGTGNRRRDMAHLPLLLGCSEIAGFPRSANCGSEFFHSACLLLPPPPPLFLPPCSFSCSLLLSEPPIQSLSPSNGLKSHFRSTAVVISDYGDWSPAFQHLHSLLLPLFFSGCNFLEAKCILSPKAQ